MNYINLFRKLCYKDKPINYFRGLPGEEGKLFRQIVSWLEGYYKRNNEHDNSSEKIQIALNRVRANYLGIIFEVEHNGVATNYDDDRLNNILAVLYFKSVKDPTKYEDIKSKADILLGIIQLHPDKTSESLTPSLKERLSDVHWDGYEEPEPFESSFMPEIEYWAYTSQVKDWGHPAYWNYWSDIFTPDRHFFFCGYESEINFILGLFKEKNWKFTALDSLKNALIEKRKEVKGI